MHLTGIQGKEKQEKKKKIEEIIAKDYHNLMKIINSHNQEVQ